jgi:hypothetical protein
MVDNGFVYKVYQNICEAIRHSRAGGNPDFSASAQDGFRDFRRSGPSAARLLD